MSGIIDKLDQLLKDDKNLDTRAGLHFVLELVRDSFKFIEAEKSRQQEHTQTQNSILARLGMVEHGLKEFLELRQREHEKAEAERQKWRWAIIAPLLAMILSQIMQWVLR